MYCNVTILWFLVQLCNTALMAAAYGGHADCVTLLLTAKASVHVQNEVLCRSGEDCYAVSFHACIASLIFLGFTFPCIMVIQAAVLLLEITTPSVSLSA